MLSNIVERLVEIISSVQHHGGESNLYLVFGEDKREPRFEKLEIKNVNKTKKNPSNTWRVKNILLNNQCINEHIKNRNQAIHREKLK